MTEPEIYRLLERLGRIRELVKEKREEAIKCRERARDYGTAAFFDGKAIGYQIILNILDKEEDYLIFEEPCEEEELKDEIE